MKSDQDTEKPFIAKSATDLQKLRLEKLMKHPEKPVPIPERPKEKNTPHVPDFVRNVMGSSAGAGSGEFHVYRHLRRKEYARQKFIQEKAEKELKDIEYHEKIEKNKQAAEERTSKKRAKRLKKKEKSKEKKKLNISTVKSKQDSEHSESEEENEEENEQEENIEVKKQKCEESDEKD